MLQNSPFLIFPGGSGYVSSTSWKVSVFGVCLVHIFPHLDWIQRDTPYLSVFSPNEEKHGQEKLRIRTLFTQWGSSIKFGNYWSNGSYWYVYSSWRKTRRKKKTNKNWDLASLLYTSWFNKLFQEWVPS